MTSWPSTTSLFQIHYSDYSAFNDDNISYKVGACKISSFKLLEFSICAPHKVGTYSYEFQLGTDIENLFGQMLKISLIVKKDER